MECKFKDLQPWSCYLPFHVPRVGLEDQVCDFSNLLKNQSPELFLKKQEFVFGKIIFREKVKIENLKTMTICF